MNKQLLDFLLSLVPKAAQSFQSRQDELKSKSKEIQKEQFKPDTPGLDFVRTNIKPLTDLLKKTGDMVSKENVVAGVLYDLLVPQRPEDITDQAALSLLFHGTTLGRLPKILEEGIHPIRTADFNPAQKMQRSAAFSSLSTDIANSFARSKSRFDLNRLRHLTGPSVDLRSNKITDPVVLLLENARRGNARSKVDRLFKQEQAIAHFKGIKPEHITGGILQPHAAVGSKEVPRAVLQDIIEQAPDTKTRLLLSEIRSLYPPPGIRIKSPVREILNQPAMISPKKLPEELLRSMRPTNEDSTAVLLARHRLFNAIRNKGIIPGTPGKTVFKTPKELTSEAKNNLLSDIEDGLGSFSGPQPEVARQATKAIQQILDSPNTNPLKQFIDEIVTDLINQTGLMNRSELEALSGESQVAMRQMADTMGVSLEELQSRLFAIGSPRQ